MVRTNGQRLFETCDGLIGIAGVPVGSAEIGADIGVVRLNDNGFLVILDGLRIGLTVVVEVRELGKSIEILGIALQLRQQWLSSFGQLLRRDALWLGRRAD